MNLATPSEKAVTGPFVVRILINSLFTIDATAIRDKTANIPSINIPP